MNNTSAFSISALLEHDIQELKGKRLADVFRLISFIPGETYGPHSHLRIEINYVKKGSCILHLEQESITFREGELMFITPNVKHKFEAGHKGTQLMQLEFLPELFSRFVLDMETEDHNNMSFTSFLFSGKHKVMKIVNDMRMVRVIQEIINELQTKPFYYDYQVILLYIELQILIYRYVKEQLFSGCGNAVLKKAIDYMYQHYPLNVTMDEVALYAGVSGRYLRYLFSQNLNITPVDYLNQIRVNKAFSLLKTSNLSVKEVSFQCGFRSPQYFSRIFKQFMVFSPRKIEYEHTSV